MPLVHVDTGRNFPEVLSFRNAFAQRINAHLIIESIPELIATRKITDVSPGQTRHFLQAEANNILIQKH